MEVLGVMMKFLLFCMVVLHSLLARAAVVVPAVIREARTSVPCLTTSKAGFVSADLRPDFTALGAQVPQRLTNIMTLLGPSGPNPKINIYYELAAPFDGRKKTIFLSEGYTPDLSLDFVVRNFPNLAIRYNLLRIHSRGSGCSPTPSGLSPLYYTHEMLAADVELVRKKLHIVKLNSWASGGGSFVLLLYSLLFPDHVGKVFLRDTGVHAPILKESSTYFENNLLPELISGEQKKQLELLSVSDPVAYRSILRFSAKAMLAGALTEVSSIVDQGLLAVDQAGGAVVSRHLEGIFTQAPAWSEARTNNECLGANESYEEFDYNDVLVSPHTFYRCSALQKRQPQPLVEPLNFAGQMHGLKNDFFIYQSYWDALAIRPLAEQLNSELVNSQIFVDTRIGRGEITQESLPCLTNLLGFFFGGETGEKITQYIEKSCK
jgi:pimeloyl-ACP methyl ester carboxylesterase